MQLGLDSLDMVELVAKINEGLSPLVRPPLLTTALLSMTLLTTYDQLTIPLLATARLTMDVARETRSQESSALWCGP